MSTHAPCLSRWVFSGSVALALVTASAAQAMGPGNLLPTLTYPDKAATVSTKTDTRTPGCRLFFCSPAE